MKLALDMTKGKEWKLIILFAIPVLFSNLFQSLYNIIDSIIVGKYVSKEALAAVSSSGNLIFLFNSFFIGINYFNEFEKFLLLNNLFNIF
jgi:Na+-driven multidrug efflux pump